MQIHEITCRQTFKRLIFHENGPTHILMIPQYTILYKNSNDSQLFVYILNSMRLVWEEIDEATIDMNEVDKLFCKPPSEASQKASKTRAKSPAKQVSPTALLSLRV